MTTAQIINRKSLYRKVCGLSDGEAARVAALIDNFKDGDIDEHEPNAETISAIEECRARKGKQASNVKELFEVLKK
ncbi:hypothetical protein FACS1894167_04030 [Synergistales bacterium]|nr:hypothetical protein FACS1894167_04030 [Synergistales bacterium]